MGRVTAGKGRFWGKTLTRTLLMQGSKAASHMSTMLGAAAVNHWASLGHTCTPALVAVYSYTYCGRAISRNEIAAAPAH